MHEGSPRVCSGHLDGEPIARGRDGAPSPLMRAAAPDPWWSQEPEALITRLATTREGLSSEAALARLRELGPNTLGDGDGVSSLGVLVAQLRSPFLLLLVFAAVISIISGELVDAGVVVAIIGASVVIGAVRELRAQRAVDALKARVRVRATVSRDGAPMSCPLDALVPGDVVLLAAGSIVPADGALLEATDLYVNEAVLSGESFPVLKQVGPVAAEATLPQRSGALFLGTNVRSGSARMLVLETGTRTALGGIAHRLHLRPPESATERGLRRFGGLLTTAMVLLVVLVVGAHLLRGRPPVETLLFSIALAVGLSPELLPAILGVNLARAAKLMAGQGVLVKRLGAIHDLGSMDVLCTDKTGTLTEGVVDVGAAYDCDGRESPEPLRLAALNATLETGLANPLDDAIRGHLACGRGGVEKLAEIPFDYARKRVSVIVAHGPGALLITKGAVAQVLAASTRTSDGRPLDGPVLATIAALERRWGEQGVRSIAVATRDLQRTAAYSRDDEQSLTLVGFVTFIDRPKPGVRTTLSQLADLGVDVKVITGDSALVARNVCALVGLDDARVLTGAELARLDDEALWHAAERTTLFAEVDPNQKERIILALKKTGHVVGFLGDGVNDAPAMHAADTSISVDGAVDVARAAADFVLLERDLAVIRAGILEGRRTFLNALKYLLTTTSANLGNMISMALASLFLPFLPLTSSQILLNNFLSDIPALGLAADRVDPELLGRPRRWDMRFIARFMLAFGLLSTAFDLLLFAVLVALFHVDVAAFRTAWFVESLLTELAVALVLRTARPMLTSRPGKLLLGSTILVAVAALALPFMPALDALGFVPLPGSISVTVVALTIAYVLATEALKRRFGLRPDA